MYIYVLARHRHELINNQPPPNCCPRARTHTHTQLLNGVADSPAAIVRGLFEEEIAIAELLWEGWHTHTHHKRASVRRRAATQQCDERTVRFQAPSLSSVRVCIRWSMSGGTTCLTLLVWYGLICFLHLTCLIRLIEVAAYLFATFEENTC